MIGFIGFYIVFSGFRPRYIAFTLSFLGLHAKAQSLHSILLGATADPGREDLVGSGALLGAILLCYLVDERICQRCGLAPGIVGHIS